MPPSPCRQSHASRDSTISARRGDAGIVNLEQDQAAGGGFGDGVRGIGAWRQPDHQARVPAARLEGKCPHAAKVPGQIGGVGVPVVVLGDDAAIAVEQHAGIGQHPGDAEPAEGRTGRTDNHLLRRLSRDDEAGDQRIPAALPTLPPDGRISRQ